MKVCCNTYILSHASNTYWKSFALQQNQCTEKRFQAINLAKSQIYVKYKHGSMPTAGSSGQQWVPRDWMEIFEGVLCEPFGIQHIVLRSQCCWFGRKRGPWLWVHPEEWLLSTFKDHLFPSLNIRTSPSASEGGWHLGWGWVALYIKLLCTMCTYHNLMYVGVFVLIM